MPRTSRSDVLREQLKKCDALGFHETIAAARLGEAVRTAMRGPTPPPTKAKAAAPSPPKEAPSATAAPKAPAVRKRKRRRRATTPPRAAKSITPASLHPESGPAAVSNGEQPGMTSTGLFVPEEE